MLARTMSRKLMQMPARWLAREIAPCRLNASVVSFTFDDFPSSALDIGGRILADQGAAGTFYAAFGLANTRAECGWIGRTTDLAACVERGHEIACHTYDHLDCQAASAAQIQQSISQNQAVARELGLPPLKHFAYPFGRYGMIAKRTVMRHYASARTVFWGVNRGNIDLALLKSVPLYSHPRAPDLTPYLDTLQCEPSWLILYTHDVSEQPSHIGCTPQKLHSTIRQVTDIGVSVLPVGTVVDKLLTGLSVAN
jgi:peptidoglycan/xylan/chitin deacetylase (PgdA/CDA1 family)